MPTSPKLVRERAPGQRLEKGNQCGGDSLVEVCEGEAQRRRMEGWEGGGPYRSAGRARLGGAVRGGAALGAGAVVLVDEFHFLAFRYLLVSLSLFVLLLFLLVLKVGVNQVRRQLG